MADIRYAQFCPLTRAVEILGERWTILIVRELLAGPLRFSDLKQRLPGVSSSVLAGRMARLEEKGLVLRRDLPPPAPSTVYELAEAGRALRPVLIELTRWGLRFLDAPCPQDRFQPQWLLLGLEVFARREPTPPCSLRIVVTASPSDVQIYLSGGPHGTVVSAEPHPVEASVKADGFELLLLASGLLDPQEAQAGGRIGVEGDPAAVALLPRLFDFRATAQPGPEAGATSDAPPLGIFRDQTQGATK